MADLVSLGALFGAGAPDPDLARLGFSIASIWNAEQRAGYMDANSIQE